MIVANGVEAIDHIVQASEELSPNQVVGELGPFLAGTYLEDMIAWEGLDQTLKATRAIGAAINKVESPTDRTTLGVNAADSLINVMLNDEIVRDTHDECAADWPDQASRYVEVIEDPKEQALKYGELAEGTAHLTGIYETETLKRSLGWRASLFLDNAVESAQDIADPVARSFTLIRLAEVSAGLVVSSSENVGAEDDPQLASHLRAGPIEIYEAALEQTSLAVRRDADRHHDRPRQLILSMAESAAKVRDDDPELAKELIDMMVTAIDEEVTSYVLDGPASDVPVIEKAINLDILGSDLSRIIDKKYSPDQSSDSRQQLIEKMVELFEASQIYRQEVAQSSRYKDHIHDTINFTSPKLEAAERLLDSDPEVAEKLITLGFDFALTHDRGRVVDKDSASKYIEEVRQLAERRPTVVSAVELFSMAYQFGRRPHEPDMKLSNEEDLRYTAFRLMWSLEDAPDEKHAAIDDIDRQLIDFTVKVAIKDGKAKEPTYPRYRIEHLQKLGQYVADPDRRQYISDQYEALKAKEVARKRPTSRIAAIAFDNWSRV